jgi:adenylosuccinate lyase
VGSAGRSGANRDAQSGSTEPLRKLKELTRGEKIDEAKMRNFVENLDLPVEDKARLLQMAPGSYTGLAAQLVTEAS